MILSPRPSSVARNGPKTNIGLSSAQVSHGHVCTLFVCDFTMIKGKYNRRQNGTFPFWGSATV